MKKLLFSLATLVIVATSAVPAIVSFTSSNNSTNNDNSGFKSYQDAKSFLDYLNSNTVLQQLLISDSSLGLNGYKYVDSTLNFTYTPVQVPDNSGNKQQKTKVVNEITGVLLMNGSIQSTFGSPNIVNQHIVDNSSGANPITVNYDSNKVEETSIVSGTVSGGVNAGISGGASLEIPLDEAGADATLNIGISGSVSGDYSKNSFDSKTVSEEVTFDKFSTTVPTGKIEEIDYVVINDINKFNMVLKTEMDLNKSTFNFSNGVSTKSISWEQIINNKNLEYTFGLYLDQLNVHTGFDKGFLSVPKMLDPNDPNTLILNLQHVYAFIPLSFSVSGFSSIITQKSLN